MRIRTILASSAASQLLREPVCGAFWLDVPGTADQPPRGSAFNSQECDTIGQLLRQLLDLISRYGSNETTIGIVTPFREQARRLQRQVQGLGLSADRQGNGSEMITVGTAHVLQGDERDIVIFSPVLAPGLSGGTLRWLDRTTNLLNVAVTRARRVLIVVGDLEFCRGLPEDNKYHRLASYIDTLPNGTLKRIEDLALFGTQPPLRRTDIIGHVVDPAKPEENQKFLRQLVSSCRDSIWWLDTYLDNGVFDLLLDVFSQPELQVSQVRLLTADRKLKGGKPQISSSLFAAARAQLRQHGINLEVRVVSDVDIPHDRLLYSADWSINMPPFHIAYGFEPRLSEYTRSNTDAELFNQYWQRASDLTPTGSTQSQRQSSPEN